MCTALSLSLDSIGYFGRNLDLDVGFGQSPTITPRHHHFSFRNGEEIPTHEALVGMACTVAGYPLYAEATNESGLSIAGLNFPGNAVYNDAVEGKTNVAPFELIPYVLTTCTTVDEVTTLAERLNIWAQNFMPQVPNSPLHWMVADAEKSIVLESRADGLHVFDNPYGVLTNNPPFEFHRDNLALHANTTTRWPDNTLDPSLDLTPVGVGFGGHGLPGDTSPASRFVRAAFLAAATRNYPEVAHHSGAAGDLSQAANHTDSSAKPTTRDTSHDEGSRVGQFFHILSSVGMVRGSTQNQQQAQEYTIYSTCMNTRDGVFYYTTYDNNQITAIDLRRADLDASTPISFPLVDTQQISYAN